MGGFMTGRATANLLSRTTAILAACFIATSLALALIAKHGRDSGRSPLDRITAPATAPAGVPAAPVAPGAPVPSGVPVQPPPAPAAVPAAPATPATPAAPAAPIAR
jgi:preprotein translocase subunit SecG